MRKLIILGALMILAGGSKPYSYQLALVKYNGGGDWYANPSSLINLAKYANANLNANINPQYATVEIGSPNLFNYPFLHITGHGNIVLSNAEAQNLRQYLMAGGFLYIDDNYGLDKYIRDELQKVFPEKELSPLSPRHAIFNQVYPFPEGLPKIHRHDNKPPEAWGYYVNGRLAVLYTHESDLGDGWEDPRVHNDPVELHRKALRMGANILMYALNNP